MSDSSLPGMMNNPLNAEAEKLDDISRYYRIKSHLHIKDEYHEQIALKDINYMKKSFAYVVISPFCGFLLMQLLRMFRDKFSMSVNYQFRVQKLQQKYGTGGQEQGKYK